MVYKNLLQLPSKILHMLSWSNCEKDWSKKNLSNSSRSNRTATTVLETKDSNFQS